LKEKTSREPGGVYSKFDFNNLPAVNIFHNITINTPEIGNPGAVESDLWPANNLPMEQVTKPNQECESKLNFIAMAITIQHYKSWI